MIYIEKEATLAKLKTLKSRWGSTLTARGIAGAIEVVENMEEASIAEASTPTPAITGYWEETESVTRSKNGREVHSTVYACSECHTSNGRKKANYCSECGADMRGKSIE